MKPRFTTNSIKTLMLRYCLPLVGAVCMCYLSAQNSTDIPKWDAYPTTGEPLVKSLDGNLTMADLTTQVVDNRMPFTRLVHLVVARMTMWSEPMQHLVCVLLGAFTVLFLVRMAWQTWPDGGWRPWLVGVCAGLTWFSLSGFMLWTYAPFLAHVLPAFLTVATMWVMNSKRAGYGRLGIGLLLAFLATNSFIYGWLCWGIIVWHLLGWRLQSVISTAQLAVSLALVLGCVAVTGYWYFDGYEMGGQPGLGGRVLADPGRYGNFFLQWLGSGLGNAWPTLGKELRVAWQYPLAWWSGAGILSLVVWAGWRGLRNRQQWLAAWPWLGLFMWGMLGGVLVTLGRTDFASEAAFWPRYQLLVYACYLSVMVLVLLQWETFPKLVRWLTPAFASLALLGWINGTVTGYNAMRGDYFTSQSIHGAAVMKDVAPTPRLLNQLQPGSFPMVQRVLGYLNPLGYIRPGIIKDPRVTAARIESSGPYEGKIEGQAQANGPVELAGWAVKTDLRCPVDAIVISVQAEGAEEIWWTVAEDRKQARRQASKMKLPYANSRIGWALGEDVSFPHLQRKPLPDGKLTFRAYALDLKSFGFHRLSGEVKRE